MFEKNIRHFLFSDPVQDLIILLIDALAVHRSKNPRVLNG